MFHVDNPFFAVLHTQHCSQKSGITISLFSLAPLQFVESSTSCGAVCTVITQMDVSIGSILPLSRTADMCSMPAAVQDLKKICSAQPYQYFCLSSKFMVWLWHPEWVHTMDATLLSTWRYIEDARIPESCASFSPMVARLGRLVPS